MHFIRGSGLNLHRYIILIPERPPGILRAAFFLNGPRPASLGGERLAADRIGLLPIANCHVRWMGHLAPAPKTPLGAGAFQATRLWRDLRKMPGDSRRAFAAR